MKNKILKNQKGFAASDALIAILIIALFVGLIAVISYNIYISNSSVKRMSTATNYIVDMFEYIDKIYYDDVTKDNLSTYFNEKYGEEAKVVDTEENIPFNINLEITNYNKTEGNDGKLDLVKQIVMKVNYKLGNKNQTVEMTKIKSRETYITPNKPNLKTVPDAEGKNIYPIKKINTVWVICDEKEEWYNYESGNWALVLVTNKEYNLDAQINIDIPEEDAIYAWIPRYVYDTKNNIKFLYSNTDYYINVENNYNKMVKIDENYTKPTEFTSSITGIWTTDKESAVYKTLNEVYPLNS